MSCIFEFQAMYSINIKKIKIQVFDLLEEIKRIL
jgi:hypothetical protein